MYKYIAMRFHSISPTVVSGLSLDDGYTHPVLVWKMFIYAYPQLYVHTCKPSTQIGSIKGACGQYAWIFPVVRVPRYVYVRIIRKRRCPLPFKGRRTQLSPQVERTTHGWDLCVGCTELRPSLWVRLVFRMNRWWEITSANESVCLFSSPPDWRVYEYA